MKRRGFLGSLLGAVIAAPAAAKALSEQTTVIAPIVAKTPIRQGWSGGYVVEACFSDSIEACLAYSRAPIWPR